MRRMAHGVVKKLHLEKVQEDDCFDAQESPCVFTINKRSHLVSDSLESDKQSIVRDFEPKLDKESCPI